MVTIISRALYYPGVVNHPGACNNTWFGMYHTGTGNNTRPCTYNAGVVNNTGMINNTRTVTHYVMIAHNYVWCTPVTGVMGPIYVIISICPWTVNSYLIAAANIVGGITWG